MAKVLTVITTTNAEKNTVDVSFLLEDGTQTPVIGPGFELFTAEEAQKLFDAQKDLHEARIAEMQDEIRVLNIALQIRDEPRPLLHEERQDVPVPRTLDKLAPLDALMPHPSLDTDMFEIGEPAETSAGEPAEAPAGEPSKE